MKYSERLKQAAPKLVAHPVCMSDVPGMFEEGEEPVFYVASLTALEKDAMDNALVAHQERNGLTDAERSEIYRTFCVAYCLCDKDNEREELSVQKLDALVDMIGQLGNQHVRRLWNCVNMANSILGVEDDLQKKFEAQKASTGDGSGE